MKKNMKKKDDGSLTPTEYEEIFYALKEYCRVAPKVEEPFYVNDVRVTKLPKIHKIMEKMKHRMEVEYPNSFLA